MALGGSAGGPPPLLPLSLRGWEPGPGARRRRKVSCAPCAPCAGGSAGPGDCRARAAASPTRCCGDAACQRGGGGARAGAVTAATGRGRPEALPLRPRWDCGTSGGARIPSPPRSGPSAAPAGPRASAGLPAPRFSRAVCILLRMCFPFSNESGNLAAARGFLG